MEENKDIELNPKQKKFVNSVASGDSATNAYIEFTVAKKVVRPVQPAV